MERSWIRRCYLLLATTAILLLVSSTPAFASVHGFEFANATSTVQNPSVVLNGGTAGLSSVSSVPDAATASITAGLTFYETASAPTSCSSPTVDTSTTAPGTSGSFALTAGQTACLWTPQYPVSSTIYAGTSTLNVWAAETTPPTVDASAVTTTKFGIDASGQTTGTASASLTVTLSTAYTNELVIAYVSWYDSHSYTVSMSGGSLTWAARGSEVSNGNHHIEEFYAVASSLLSTAGIKATFSTTLTSGEGAVLTVFTIAGANTASPFDSHSGLPATGTGTSKAPSASVTTSNLHDLLIGGLISAYASGLTCTVADPPYRVYGSACATAGTTDGAVGDAVYEYVTSAQAGTSVGETLSASEAWAFEADAVQMSAGVTLTTTASPEVIIVLVSGTTAFTAMVTDGSGLTWTSRQTATNTAEVNEVYAIASSTLSSDGIGVTFSALGGLYTIVAAGIKGANTASPFDGTAQAATGTSTSPSASLTTSAEDDLVIGLVATGLSDTFTAGSGFALAQSGLYGSMEDELVATAGATAVGFTLGTSTTWAIIADAIEAPTTQLTVNEYTTTSGGTTENNLVSSGATGIITPTEAQVSTSFASSTGTVPASGYVEVQLAASASVTIYWGSGQLTNFQTPAVFNYILAVNNPTTSSWEINLGTMTSLTSNLGRLTSLTISFTSPASTQIAVTGGSLSQSSGTEVTLAASSTNYIEVVASANAIPTGSTSPSTITFSLMVLSTTSTSYALYTIALTVG